MPSLDQFLQDGFVFLIGHYTALWFPLAFYRLTIVLTSHPTLLCFAVFHSAAISDRFDLSSALLPSSRPFAALLCEQAWFRASILIGMVRLISISPNESELMTGRAVRVTPPSQVRATSFHISYHETLMLTNRYPTTNAWATGIPGGPVTVIETNNTLNHPTGPEYQFSVGEGMCARCMRKLHASAHADAAVR